MAEENALVVMRALVPAVVFGPGGVDAVLEQVKAEARKEEIDISTEKGRKACASLAYKIARSKTALDDMGKSLGDEMRRQVDAINTDRRRIREELDALKDEIRGPLDRWEQREADRIKGHEDEIARIEWLAQFDTDEPPLIEVEARIAALKEHQRDWQEFEVKGLRAIQGVLASLEIDHDRLTALYAAREKEAHRQAEEAARLKAEHEAKIAALAAEQARKEAEEKARREAEAAAAEAKRREDELRAKAEREAEEARKRQEAIEAETRRQAEEAEARAAALKAQAEREEQERQAAERRAAEAEEARKIAERRAEEDARIAKVEAALREREHQEALRRAEAEAQAAERRRQNEEAERQRAETRAREADQRHRAKINGEARDALMKATGLSQDEARDVIVAIAKGQVSHIAIGY